MTSKLQKNKSYHKLNKGGVSLEEMPDYSNDVSKKKREELGEFVYEMPEYEAGDAVYKGPIEF